MSHFPVMIRVPAQTEADDVMSEVERLLAPYQENNMGDCPKEYLEFESIEENKLEDYQTGTITRIRLADGREFSPYDDRFVQGGLLDKEYVYPDDSERVELALTEVYETFEQYMAEYCGYEKRDPEHGEYGYWHNPNSRWDWWVLGGRWAGFFPVRSNAESAHLGQPGVFGNQPDKGTADVLRICDIDQVGVDRKTRERIEGFWSDYVAYCSDTIDNRSEYYIRRNLLNLGLLQCKDGNELTEADRTLKLKKWERREDRYDVLDDTYLETEKRKAIEPLLQSHFNKLRPYAYLDKNGWREPSKMGWWGMTGAGPEDYEQFSDAFEDWFQSGDSRDWVAVVDCHV